MDAKLIRVIPEKDNDPFYYREYEYECIRCGAHFFRHTCNDRINPYCGKCSRENERIKRRFKIEQKKKDIQNEVLYQLRKDIDKIPEFGYYSEFSNKTYKHINKDEVLFMIDRYIYKDGVTHGKRD